LGAFLVVFEELWAKHLETSGRPGFKGLSKYFVRQMVPESWLWLEAAGSLQVAQYTHEKLKTATLQTLHYNVSSTKH
jgi:hypothetical protein